MLMNSNAEQNQRGEEEDIPVEAYGVLHRLAGNWTDILDAQDLVLKPLKGAMTNHLYECHWPREEEGEPRKVLVRLYGRGSELFFKRDDEVMAFERMAQLGQGPRLLGRFPNGRVEEFLHARTLSAFDLRDSQISGRIAKKLREFHQLDMPGPREPRLWEQLGDWLQKAMEICAPKLQEEFHLQILKKEIVELREKISKPEERVGFCHNDLQYGNIMINEKDGSITIVDYEYASFNPIAFDIANHFCEMTANYHTETPYLLDISKYPDLRERYQFIETYLKTSSDQYFSSVEVEELARDTDHYALASHLYWGLWGILSASFSEIKFNYLEYARQRFKLYHQVKPLVLF